MLRHRIKPVESRFDSHPVQVSFSSAKRSRSEVCSSGYGDLFPWR